VLQKETIKPLNKMKSAELSLRVFGTYMILVPGLGLIAIPAVMLDLFQLSHGDYLWMARMIGLLALLLGVYYYFMANYNTTKLYLATVVNIYIAAVFMIGLWASGQVEIMILLFAAVDAAGATWTLIAHKKSVKDT
jgi:hypothetical protein